MIAGIFHNGSGLGNQLAQYIMTRVLAMDKGYEWGMMWPENFKGNHLFRLDMGEPVIFPEEDKGYPYPEPERIKEAITKNFVEQSELHPDGSDIRGYDWRIKDLEDNTIIDGIFQGEDYFKHHLNKIRNWLEIEPREMADDLCVINIRGGEYRAFPHELLLPKTYWEHCIKKMQEINPRMRFEIRTDDPEYARYLFPHFPIDNNLSEDWKKIRYAKYLILSNSSFSILPSSLNENLELCIAPKYHARYNVSDGYWALGQNIYSHMTYMDKEGRLSSAEECEIELNEYNKKNDYKKKV